MRTTVQSALLVLTGIIALPLHGENWPHYLGPNGDSTISEKNLRTEFPDSGLPLLWSVETGGGYSSPAVVDDRVFVMDRLADPYKPQKVEGNPNFIRASIPGRERVRCLDAGTGKMIWEHLYDCEYSTAFPYAIGPRCTPTFDEGRVFTLGAEGHLFCLEAAGGKVIWSKDFKKEYGLEVPEWGCAAHPLVDRHQVICIVGGEGSTVVSFDKVTGKELWRALSASKPGYCPPVFATIHGLRQLLVWHGDGVASLEPDTGKLHWSIGLKPAYGMAVGAPRVHGDLIHVMGYKGVSAAIKVAPDNGSAKLAWGKDLRKGVAGVFNTAHLDSRGFLYSGDDRGLFRCVDIRDGSRVWETRAPLQNKKKARTGAWPSAFTNFHKPSGRTFIYNDHGELITAVLSREGYREISRAGLIEPTHEVGGRKLVWSAPAFSNGRIFLRNDAEIRCYDLSLNSRGAKVGTALLDTQEKLVGERHCPSHICQVAMAGKTLYRHAVNSTIEGDREVDSETIFPIWSMSKPVTSVAAMILIEEGAFKLDDPVATVLPRLANLKVKGAKGRLQPLRKPITYRDLLRHTSGIAGYDGSFDEEGTWKQVMELDDLDGLIGLLEKIPLEHQPGERYTYGLSTAVLGCAIEKHSGKPFAQFLNENIFQPLGMKDTRFFLTKDDRRRFQPLFVHEKGSFRPGTPKEDELYYRPGSRLSLGGEGLVSTAGDFGRFCDMLVGRGRTPNGGRIISEQSLTLMLTDQLGKIPGFGGAKHGQVCGFGFQILKDPTKDLTGAPEGVFGWGGYHTTNFWVDPVNKLYGLSMTRRYPYHYGVEGQLKKALYQNLKSGS